LVEVFLGDLVFFGFDFGGVFDEENALSLRHGLWFDYIDVIALFKKSLPKLIELHWEHISLREEIVFFREQLTHFFQLPAHLRLISKSKDPWKLRNSLVWLQFGHEFRRNCTVDPDYVEVGASIVVKFIIRFLALVGLIDRVESPVVLVVVEGLVEGWGDVFF